MASNQFAQGSLKMMQEMQRHNFGFFQLHSKPDSGAWMVQYQFVKLWVNNTSMLAADSCWMKGTSELLQASAGLCIELCERWCGTELDVATSLCLSGPKGAQGTCLRNL